MFNLKEEINYIDKVIFNKADNSTGATLTQIYMLQSHNHLTLNQFHNFFKQFLLGC